MTNSIEVYSLYRVLKNGNLKYCATYQTYGAAIIEKMTRMSRYPNSDYSVKTELVESE